MGCDIHFYVETRQPDGSWKTADKWAPCKYDADEIVVDYNDAFYSGRSYYLFAILAGVRNSAGFVPIAEPRGVPEDACAEYKAEVARWDGDGHSHSYLTLAEIFAYDWTQKTKLGGWVPPFGWAQWRDQGKPESYSGGVGGGGVVHSTPEAFETAWQTVREEFGYPEQRHASAHLRPILGGDQGMARFCEILGGSPFCYVEWEEPYLDAISSEFWGKTIPRLVRLGKPEDVRITFYFDN